MSKGGGLELGSLTGQDNPYKLVCTLFTLSVRGTQWFIGLGINRDHLLLISRCELSQVSLGKGHVALS